MATASDEFLVRLRYWFVSGGMITRSALRNDDEPHCLARRQAQRRRGFALPFVHRLDARAHILGNEACRIDAQGQHQRNQFRDQCHAAGEIKPPQAGILKTHRQTEDEEHEQREPRDQPERPVQAPEIAARSFPAAGAPIAQCRMTQQPPGPAR